MDPTTRSGRRRDREKKKEIAPEPTRRITGRGKKKVHEPEQHSEIPPTTDSQTFSVLGVDYPATQAGPWQGMPPGQFHGTPQSQYHGMQQGYYQGMQPGQFQGMQQGPYQGMQPGPYQGMQPGPYQGMQPGPGQGMQPGPYQGIQQVPYMSEPELGYGNMNLLHSMTPHHQSPSVSQQHPPGYSQQLYPQYSQQQYQGTQSSGYDQYAGHHGSWSQQSHQQTSVGGSVSNFHY